MTDPKEIANIIDRLVKNEVGKVRDRTFKRGVISAIYPTKNKSDVLIEGNPVATKSVLSLASYRPKVGDKVVVLSIGSTGANLLILGKIDEESNTWTVPTLTNSWVVYDSTYSTPGYMLTSDGFVQLKGMVKGGTASSAIFTLPVGMRPLRRMLFPSISNNALGRIDVAPNGQVMFNTGNNAWITLDHIRFKAEQ